MPESFMSLVKKYMTTGVHGLRVQSCNIAICIIESKVFSCLCTQVLSSTSDYLRICIALFDNFSIHTWCIDKLGCLTCAVTCACLGTWLNVNGYVMDCISQKTQVFRWGTHLCMSLFPSSVYCALYLRNCTSSDHNFWNRC